MTDAKEWGINKRHEIPLHGVLVVEFFDVRGIDFMVHLEIYTYF